MQNFTEDDFYNDFYKRALIKPPQDNIDEETKYTRIVVDSRVRNKALFPNPNNYEVLFEDDINDVKSAKLVYMDMPMPIYLINSFFNKITFKIGATSYTATISDGNYTASELATELTNEMNELVSSSTFNITYNTRLDKFIFNATESFSLQFVTNTNQINILLGFLENKIYTSVTVTDLTSYPNVITAEYRKNFDYNNYIIMDIEQFDTLKSIDRDLNKSFAIIPRTYNQLNVNDKLNIIKHFSPSIGRLTKLRIKLYDRFGNPYDFQNMDHRFELLMISFKQKRRYMI
jgi:hypothetical protein